MPLIVVLRVLLLIVAAAIFFAPPPEGFSVATMHAAGLVLMAVGLWATQALPEHITGLLFLLLAVVTAVATPAVVFSGFTSGTLWLVLGGLVIAEAVRATGLGERFALALLGRFTGSYVLLVSGTVLVSTLLCFVMPATLGRILLLLPILTGLCQRIGFSPRSNGYKGVLLAGIVATFQIGTGILPANAPNLVLAGAAESLYGVEFIYGEYLLVQFPVLGVLKAVLIVGITCWLFPQRPAVGEPAPERGPMSAEERRLSIVLGLALAGWATDFQHGLQPGWIALATALVVLMPRIGVLPLHAFNDRIKFGPYFYIGAVLGLGAVISETGLGAALGGKALGALALEHGADFRNFMLMAFVSTLACMLATNPAQPGLFVPVAQQLAELTGWPLNAALMTSALGFSNIVLPYAVPPLVVGAQLAGIRLRDAARYTCVLAVPSLLLLIPLNFLWWRLIGYFG